MLIQSKGKELLEKVNTILSNPFDYGILPDSNKKIKIGDIFESIIIINDWHWINIDDIIDIFITNEIEIIENEYVLAYSDNIQELTFQKKYDFENFFLPISDVGRLILYTNLKSALLISGHRTGDFEKSKVRKISKDELARKEVQLAVKRNSILFIGNLENIGEIIEVEELQSELSKLYEEIMFSELLFIDDEAHRNNACRYLSKNLNQIEFEEKLVFNLKDTCSDVRANVCLALLFLISSEMFDVNEVLPRRYSKTLSIHTIIQLLALLKHENNAYVINSAIGVLKIQNYSEQLYSLAYEVSYVIGTVCKNLTDTQVQKDCENLIRSLEDILNPPRLITTSDIIKKRFTDIAQNPKFNEIFSGVYKFVNSNKRLFEPMVTI
jgi:hypothetical protein